MATQETVRIGGLGSTDAEIIQFAKDYVQASNPSQLAVKISPLQSVRRSGDYVTVEIIYPVTFVTPFLDYILPLPMEITANSTIRVE
jgi:hypothetical protein